MGDVQSPMPLATDYDFPPLWALASGNPFPGSPLQDAYSPPYDAGYSPPVKLPGLTTASGTIYAAAGVALQNVPDTNHTQNQLTGVSKKEVGTAMFYDTFGNRAECTEHTCNGRQGFTAGYTLPTGSIQQRFSGLPDPNTGQPATPIV